MVVFCHETSVQTCRKKQLCGRSKSMMFLPKLTSTEGSPTLLAQIGASVTLDDSVQFVSESPMLGNRNCEAIRRSADIGRNR